MRNRPYLFASGSLPQIPPLKRADSIDMIYGQTNADA